jgi:hypothetical protein
MISSAAPGDISSPSTFFVYHVIYTPHNGLRKRELRLHGAVGADQRYLMRGDHGDANMIVLYFVSYERGR